MYNTILPRDVRKILEEHKRAIYAITHWLKKLGCEMSPYGNSFYEREICELTRVDISIAHTNDYIEAGPLVEDPEGLEFNIATEETVTIEFPARRNARIYKEIKKFADWETYPHSLDLKNVLLDLDSGKQNVQLDRKGCLHWKLNFKIFHVFK